MISAGNDRDDVRHSARSARRHGSRTRSASPPSRTRTSSRTSLTPKAPETSAEPFVPSRAAAARDVGARRTRSSSTSARSRARTGSPSTACSAPPHTASPAPAPPRRDRARDPRRLHVHDEGAPRRAAGGVGMIVADDRPGDPERDPFLLGVARRDRSPTSTARGCGRRWRRAAAARRSASTAARRDRDRPGRASPTSFSSGGPDAVRAPAEAGHRRAGRADHLVDAAGVRGRPVRRPRRDELLGAAHRRRRRAAPRSGTRPGRRAGEVGADVHRRRRASGTPPGRRRRRSLGRGRRARPLPGRRPAGLHRSAVALVRGPGHRLGRRRARPCS